MSHLHITNMTNSTRWVVTQQRGPHWMLLEWGADVNATNDSMLTWRSLEAGQCGLQRWSSSCWPRPGDLWDMVNNPLPWFLTAYQEQKWDHRRRLTGLWWSWIKCSNSADGTYPYLSQFNVVWLSAQQTVIVVQTVTLHSTEKDTDKYQQLSCYF